MTKDQEDAVRSIAAEGAKANEEMLKQRFPPQISAPDHWAQGDDQKSPSERPE